MACSADQKGADANNKRHERQRRQAYEAVFDAVQVIELEHACSFALAKQFPHLHRHVREGAVSSVKNGPDVRG